MTESRKTSRPSRRRVSTPAPSWVKYDAGAYLCLEHEVQFKSISASMAHNDQFHPERVKTTLTATPEQMEAGKAEMDKLRKLMGR